MFSKLLLGWFAVQIHASFPPLIPMGVPTPNGDLIPVSADDISNAPHPQSQSQSVHLEVHAGSSSAINELESPGDHPLLRKPLILPAQQLYGEPPHSTASSTSSTSTSPAQGAQFGRLVKPVKIEEERRYLTEEEPPSDYQEPAYPVHHTVEADTIRDHAPDISNFPRNNLDHVRGAISKAEASLEKLDKVRFELERELERVTDMRHRLHTRILASQIQQEMTSAGLHPAYPHRILHTGAENESESEKHLHKKKAQNEKGEEEEEEEEEEEDNAKKLSQDEDEKPPQKSATGAKSVEEDESEDSEEENSKHKHAHSKASKKEEKADEKKLTSVKKSSEEDEEEEEGTKKNDPKEASKVLETAPKPEETSKSKNEDEGTKKTLPEETLPKTEEAPKSKDEEDFFLMEKKSKAEPAKVATGNRTTNRLVRSHSKKHGQKKLPKEDSFLDLLGDHPLPPSFEIPDSLPVAPSSVVADFNATAFEKELDAILQHSKETHAARN